VVEEKLNRKGRDLLCYLSWWLEDKARRIGSNCF
jgi:hypothetical protein